MAILMRKLPLAFTAATAALLALAACGEPIAVPVAAAVDTAQVLSDLGSNVITATYAEMEGRATTLDAAARTLAATTSETNLTAAREAWRSARTPWEQSEGFLFGPVETDGFDPALDTWPFNSTDAQTLISGATPITPTLVGALDGSLKGYHGVEYILFGSDGNKPASALTARDLDYLLAVTSEIKTSAGALRQQWDPAGGNFAGQFAAAGEPGSAYINRKAALQELVNGMIGICDEVANGKIAEPFDAQDGLLEESRFSDNTNGDFQDNLRSVAHIYTGIYLGQTGLGVSALVAPERPDLDHKLRAQIDSAIARIGRMSPTFGQAIFNNRSSVEAAQGAVRDVKSTLEDDILPIFTRP
jgi:uncharacterized iron-regulated protein